MVTDERLPESSLTQNLIDPSEQSGREWEGEPPIGYAAYELPDENETVSLDAAAPETLAALRDEMTQRLAGQLLIAIAALPEEAAALIRANMSDADFDAFLDLLND